MPTVLLLRHGRTTANASGVLAGWTPGVHLDNVGQAAASAAATAIAGVAKPAALYTSPLERCQETVQPLESATGLTARTMEGLAECRYGAWTGKSIADLANEPLWSAVQRQPSSVTFPSGADFDGESMLTMQARAVTAVRSVDAEIAEARGDDAVWVAVSHGDVIKAILADALGMHLDLFQRIVVAPGSVSVVRYTSERPYVIATNADGERLSSVMGGATSGKDATVGGSSGKSEA